MNGADNRTASHDPLRCGLFDDQHDGRTAAASAADRETYDTGQSVHGTRHRGESGGGGDRAPDRVGDPPHSAGVRQNARRSTDRECITDAGQTRERVAHARSESGVADPESVDAERADTGCADSGSADAMSADVKPADTESADTMSADTESAEMGRDVAGSADTESTDPESTDPESADTMSADTMSADTKSAEMGRDVAGSADTESADTESADTESADTESADTESADTESADTESADTESADTESADMGCDVAGSVDTESADTGSVDDGMARLRRTGALVWVCSARYFLEVAHCLAEALRELGVPCRVVAGRATTYDGGGADGGTRPLVIVVGCPPHDALWPRPPLRYVYYQLEQTSSALFASAQYVEHMRGALHVWDFAPRHVATLGALGVAAASCLPLGYMPALERPVGSLTYDTVAHDAVSSWPGTHRSAPRTDDRAHGYVPETTQGAPTTDDDHHGNACGSHTTHNDHDHEENYDHKEEEEEDYDHDVALYGCVSARRDEAVRALRAAGLRVAYSSEAWGADRDRLIARSRIVLNVHHRAGASLEVHRINYALARRRCVVSEPGADALLDAAYADSVAFAPYGDALVDECVRWARDDAGRRRHERWAYRSLASRRMTDTLGEELRAHAASWQW